MQVTAIETATAETATSPFKPNQIVLWHYTRWHNIRQQSVPGVIVALNDGKKRARIKVRNMAGQIKLIDVPYSKIEVRS